MGYKRNLVDGIVFGAVVFGILFYILKKDSLGFYLGLIFILAALIASIFRRSIYKILSV